MARTIERITESIKERLNVGFDLSTSAVAEWRLWAHCVAYAIHVFEVALDTFEGEMDADVNKEVAGTLAWYNERCYAFQLGHELVFDTVTGRLGYRTDDAAARVIRIAAVNVAEGGTVFFRVATTDKDGKIVPLTSGQLLNFKNYIDAVKFAGTRSSVISTTPDEVRYEVTAYHDPANPVEAVRSAILASLDAFKTSQRFGGIVYRHRLLDAVTSAPGVVTAKVTALSRKGTDDAGFVDIDTLAYLHAGYYNYSEDSVLTLISINDIEG